MDTSQFKFPKGQKGDVWLDGRKRRKAIADHEARETTKVRKRDVRCRWPKCEYCLEWHPPLEVAHLTAKGMGGDHGSLTTADQMMLLCRLTHQDQEQHKKRIVPLTDQGTDGPCSFWAQDQHGELYLVAEEIAIGIYRP